MQQNDDDLAQFAAVGLDLPVPDASGTFEREGARLWYATYGAGPVVVLLHGGLGHSGNWAKQIPDLVASGYRVVVHDTRGHGRSTRDDRPFSYWLLAGDVVALLDVLDVPQAALVGWSDGACTALVLASEAPLRVAGVLFFACNMDPSGARPFEMTPVVERCFNRHVQDYTRLSATPDVFSAFADAVGDMQRTEPNFSAAALAQIATPVTIVHSAHDEFITSEHAEYLARTIPGAQYRYLADVSHFAPIQRPALFNQTVLEFLGGLYHRVE